MLNPGSVAEPFGEIAKEGAFVFTEKHGTGDEGCQKVGGRNGRGNIRAIRGDGRVKIWAWKGRKAS